MTAGLHQLALLKTCEEMEQVLEGLGNNFKCWLHLSPFASPCELAQEHWLGVPHGNTAPPPCIQIQSLTLLQISFSFRLLSHQVLLVCQLWETSFFSIIYTSICVFPINSPNTFVLKRSRYDLISFTKIVVVHMQEIRFT